ncbi:MAG: methyltransferase [Flavobacteriales bacterium]|nr:methyltransferase [Flavobacteriales bacterium]
MKKKIKGTINRLFGNQLLKVIETDNSFSYQEINLDIPVGVFHPKYFTSSKLLMNFMEEEQMQKKIILELGCGSAITSFIAHRNGGIVTSSDISEVAISNLRTNQEKNNVNFEAICSNLFDSIPDKLFDYILINPPYYPKNPTNEKEHAWYCGESFDYFKKLFKQLSERKIQQGIFMTLSNDCELDKIKEIAAQYSYFFKEIKADKNLAEINYLFEVVQER